MACYHRLFEWCEMERKDLLCKEEIKGRRIICFGRNIQYLSEFCSKFDAADDIVCVVDNNPKTHGKVQIGQNIFSVVSPDKLYSMELKSTAIVITCAYYKEVFEQLSSIEAVAENIEVVYQYNDIQLANEQKYLKKYKVSPLENIIIFRSGPAEKVYIKGTDFSDNAKALFEFMLKIQYNKKYQLIWFVKNPKEFDGRYSEENVKFISFDWAGSEVEEETDIYYDALFHAKYIFCTDACDFAKSVRKEQIRVQLWHGCGFKTRVNFVRCEDRYEYTTVISDMYAEIHQRIYGLRKDQVLVTGYAKHDWVYQPYDWDLSDVLEIPEASKYVLWLPTFRMADERLQELNQYDLNPATGIPIISDTTQLKTMNDLLQEKDIVLIIKLHPFQKNETIRNYHFSNIVVLSNSDLDEKDLILNRIMAHVDALISDYSSAAVDFLNADKPIAFTLDDESEYRMSRGFVFENIIEWLPGAELYHYDDLCNFITEIAMGIDSSMEKRHYIAGKMLKFRDKNNCKRIVEALNI